MNDFRGVIHNGINAIALDGDKVHVQIPLSGGAATRFGSRSVTFDPAHFRLFHGATADARYPKGIALTLAIGKISMMDWLGGEELVRVRFPASSRIRSMADSIKRRHCDAALPTRVSGLEDLADELTEHIRRVRNQIDQLPGRALYKRADTFMRLEAARDHVHHEFREDPDTEELAACAAISRAHFIRLYGSFYGISPKQDVLECKLRYAKQLLRRDQMSVWEVAEASGFGNRCAFQRMFRQRTGVTPGQFRAHHEMG